MHPQKKDTMLEYFKLKAGILIMSLFVVGFASCNQDDDIAGSTDPIPQDTIRYRYLALGDSYTIGTGLPDGTDRYPLQLVDSLNRELYRSNLTTVIAQNGWTTGNLLASTANYNPGFEFDLVSLLIGVNNQYQGLDINQYAIEFEELLQRCIEYAGGDTSNVFVLSIPDYGVTPFGASNAENIAMEIDAFNDVNRGIAMDYGITYFNITEISRLAADQPNLIAPDNLHPSAEMYSLWISAIYDDVKMILNE
jgi:lysophospholipase L1-like esterase